MIIGVVEGGSGLFADNARDFLTSPWVLLAPSLFVTWTIFAINLILESLRRRFQSVRKPV